MSCCSRPPAPGKSGLSEELSILTADRSFRLYEVRVIEA